MGAGKTTLLQSLASIIPKEFTTRGGSPETPERKHYLPEIFFAHPTDEKYQNFLRVGTDKLKISAQVAFGAKLETKDARFNSVSVSVEISASKGGSAGVFSQQLSRFQVYAYSAVVKR